MGTAVAVSSNAGGPGMSAMLGSSRRDARVQLRLDDDEVVIVERSVGTLRFWTSRLIARLESLFGPPRLHP